MAVALHFFRHVPSFPSLRQVSGLSVVLRQRSIVLHQSIIFKILFLQCACSECIQKSFLGRSSGPVLVRILQTHQPAVSWTRLGEVAIKSCWIRAHLVCDSIVFVGSTRNPRSRVHHQLTFTVIVIMSPGSNASPARGRGQHCRVHSRSLSTMSSRAPQKWRSLLATSALSKHLPRSWPSASEP